MEWAALITWVITALFGFTMLVIGKFGVAAIFAALGLLTLLAWHSREPQEA